MSIRHVSRTVAILAAAVLGSFAFLIGAFAHPAGAATLTSADGYTSVQNDPSDPNGPAHPGTPYDSGQGIDVNVVANPVLNAAGLAAASLPDTGSFYFEECEDLGGTAAGLPTKPAQCDNGTLILTGKASDGSASLTGVNAYAVFSLPTAATGYDTTASCGLSPNPCVVGIFAVNPSLGGFAEPHLFSAPFQVAVGDGSNSGDNPGDGTPEVPLAVGLPLAAAAVIGGSVLYGRRRRQRAA